MPASARRPMAWLLGALVGIACAAGDKRDGGFATLGNDEGGNAEWGMASEGGDDGDDWNNVDSGGGESTSAGPSSDSTTADPGGETGPDPGVSTSGSMPGGSESTGGAAGNPYAGEYAGTASGSCNLIGDVNATWTITVHEDGTFDGNVDVDTIGNVGFDGTVSDEGEVVTNDGSCGFLGQIEDDLTGSGSFSCDAGCNGTWSGAAV